MLKISSNDRFPKGCERKIFHDIKSFILKERLLFPGFIAKMLVFSPWGKNESMTYLNLVFLKN